MASEGKKKETHVLMVAFAAHGHMNPMLRLGKRLVSKGINVTFAVNEYGRDLIVNSPAFAGIHLEFYSDGLSLDADRKTSMDLFMESICKYGPVSISALIQTIGVEKFSCIINNPFVPWVADVAAELEIPCAMLWIQPCMLYAIYYRFYNNLNLFPTSTNPNMSVELPGFPLLASEDLPSFILPSNTSGPFPKLLAELFQNMNKIKWVLGNSFYELEKDIIDSMKNVHPIRPVGPLVPSTLLLGENDQNLHKDKCIEWLDHQKNSSVIYISFGTIIEFSTKEMEVVAKCLKKTKLKFLWAVKKGEELLPLGFPEEIKDQGLIVKWSPQVEVLGHPSVACFLTHCGWNSLIETITAGVPVIAYPKWTDQPTNAKLIDILHVGVRLRPGQDGELSGEELEKCIEEIMVGPSSEEYKKNAAELKQEAREAMAHGGSSDRNIQWFVDEIKGYS